MRHASFATGIGGFDLGFEQAGIESVFQCEIEPFCLQVLERHWPDVPKAHDLRTLEASTIPDADVWTCGFPCQDVSVAGKRAGLRGERSNLWFDFAGLVEQRQPEWLVVENVAGLLSSNGGADMALIVGQLSSFGYGVAWRVLDSRYFGVPQRRRRVYLVGHLGDLRAAEVLFERKGSGGDSETSREAWQDVAYTIGTSADRISGNYGEAVAYAIQDDSKLTLGVGDAFLGVGGSGHPTIAAPITAGMAKGAGVNDGRKGKPQNLVVETLRVGGRDNKHRAGDSSDNTPIVAVKPAQTGSNGWGVLEDGTIHTLDSTGSDAVAVAANQRGELRTSPNHPSLTGERSAKQYAGVLSPTPNTNGVRGVAGLPPRLDSPRYRSLGNAVTVNVARWLGRRIVAVQP